MSMTVECDNTGCTECAACDGTEMFFQLSRSGEGGFTHHFCSLVCLNAFLTTL